MMTNMIDHDDLWQVLAQYPGAFVEYMFSTATNGPKTAVRARIHPKYDGCDSVVVESRSRRGALVEEHFKCPHQAYCYWAAAVFDAGGALLQRLVAAAPPPPPPEPEPQQPGRTASEEQRAQILGSLDAGNRQASNERAALMAWMQDFETKAEQQRTLLLQTQQAAAAEAQRERKEQAAEAERQQ